jgi:7-keto-8-aminopelargonate synthetase-like enzyme
MESAPGPLTILNGRQYLYFAGTGYLGLQAHPEVIAAAQSAVAQFGVHSATSRGGFGNVPPVLEVERRTAELLGAQGSCYLVSGYAVNFALAAACEGVGLALIDESAHDCLREATGWLKGLSNPVRTVRHCDANHLAELLHEELRPRQHALLMTDGVFATSGDLAPVADYLQILDGYPGATLLVDDAHGLAALGENGRGSLEHAGVSAERVNTLKDSDGSARVLLGGTLSKAVGGHGGAIAGTAEFLGRLRAASGWFRGSSAPAAPVAAATAKALEIVQREPRLRRQLAANVTAAREGLRGLGIDVKASPSPIIGFRLSDAAHMARVQSQLLDDGIAVGYARDYAGAGADGMLRVAVFATHTPEMIDRLVATLGRVL